MTSAERVGNVAPEVLKVAVSPGLTGAIVGDQFAPVFQFELKFPTQVESTASAGLGQAVKSSATNNEPMTVNRTSATANWPIEVARKRRNSLASLDVIFLAIMVFAVLGVCEFRKAFASASASSGGTKRISGANAKVELRYAQCSDAASSGANQN